MLWESENILSISQLEKWTYLLSKKGEVYLLEECGEPQTNISLVSCGRSSDMCSV